MEALCCLGRVEDAINITEPENASNSKHQDGSVIVSVPTPTAMSLSGCDLPGYWSTVGETFSLSCIDAARYGISVIGLCTS